MNQPRERLQASRSGPPTAGGPAPEHRGSPFGQVSVIILGGAIVVLLVAALFVLLRPGDGRGGGSAGQQPQGEPAPGADAPQGEGGQEVAPVPQEAVTPDRGRRVETGPGPELLEFRGEGPVTTEPFRHDGGLVVVRMAHTGEEAFSVTVFSEDGQMARTLSDAQGAYRGSRALGLQAGSYQIAVNATGAWAVTFEQPRFTDGPELDVTFESGGDSATDPFRVPQAGPVRFEWAPGRDAEQVNLRARVLGVDGEVVADFAVGGASTTTQDLPAGLYVLDVQTTLPWRVGVSQ